MLPGAESPMRRNAEHGTCRERFANSSPSLGEANEVTNIQFNMIFYEHYAVIPRGTDSLFLKDQFIFIGSSRLKNFIKNFHLIFNFIKFYKIILTLLNHSFYFSIKKLIILLP